MYFIYFYNFIPFQNTDQWIVEQFFFPYHCNSIKMEAVGKLLFDRNNILKNGLFGTSFKGKFENVVDVAIQRVENVNFTVDTSLLWKSQVHLNVLRYFCTENDHSF